MIKKGITRKLGEKDDRDNKDTMDNLVKTVKVRKAVTRGK